jgi:hypothetical protein
LAAAKTPLREDIVELAGALADQMREHLPLFLAAQIGTGGRRGQIKLRCVARMLGQGSGSPKLGSSSGRSYVCVQSRRWAQSRRCAHRYIALIVTLRSPLPCAQCRVPGDPPLAAKSARPSTRLPENGDTAKAKIGTDCGLGAPSAPAVGMALTVNGHEPILWQIESARQGVQIVHNVTVVAVGFDASNRDSGSGRK